MAEKSILHNVRIVDFTWVLAGPYATRLLADFGAEVIKVQPLTRPEDDDAFSRGYYNTWNRNKLSITLNMSKPEGVTLAKGLISVSDAVVENFTPRVMKNWGLDYDNLEKIRPGIIMVSMSMMGQQSIHPDYVGYGPTVQAQSGMTALTSFPRKPPIGPGFSYADHIAGLYASLGLLGALEQRKTTGTGQFIDISEVAAMRSLIKDNKPEQAPQNVYQCKDGRWCAIGISTEAEWQVLKRVLGRAWAEHDKFATPAGRWENRAELDRLIGTWVREHDSGEVIQTMQQNGIAAGILQDAADLAKDPQLAARGFFIKDRKAPLIDASPIRMEKGGAQYLRLAPAPGQDNDYVFGKLLGLSKKEIQVLKDSGVI